MWELLGLMMAHSETSLNVPRLRVVDMPQSAEDQKKNVTIYTDGGCLGNPGPGGYGVVLRYGAHEKRLSGGFRQTTNNRMEITAAIVGLEALTSPCAVTLHSDSRYLVDAMSLGWVQRWKANGWRRNKTDKALNVDLWERLMAACRQHTVTFVWVRGHAGHKWNEVCDELSKKAATGKNLPVDEQYERESGAGGGV
jgi:ribonuclease HI